MTALLALLRSIPLGRHGASSETPAAMFRNQYDTDVTTWSPQGRIHQVMCGLGSVLMAAA